MEEKDLTPELAHSLAELDNKVYTFLEEHEKTHPGNFYISSGKFDYGFRYFKDETIVPQFVLDYFEEWNKGLEESSFLLKNMPKRKNPKFNKQL